MNSYLLFTLVLCISLHLSNGIVQIGNSTILNPKLIGKLLNSQIVPPQVKGTSDNGKSVYDGANKFPVAGNWSKAAHSLLQLGNATILHPILIGTLMRSPLISVEAKGALATGKAVYQGLDKFLVTGDLNQAVKSTAESGLDSFNQLFLSSDAAKITKSALALLLDIMHGKNMKDSASLHGMEALKQLSYGELIAIAIEAAQDAQNGARLEEAVAKHGQQALNSFAEKQGFKGALDLVGDNLGGINVQLPNVGLQGFKGQLEDIQKKIFRKPQIGSATDFRDKSGLLKPLS